MKDDDDVYYFKFTSMTGLEQGLEKGPWMIRNQPLILTKWSPNMSLSKDKVTKVPVWVKIHKVPVVAYSEDGLSLIATQIGKPIMLDTFTSAMCAEPWGRIGFARALIEVTAEKELKQEVTMAVPIVEGDGHTMERMNIEYEWKPSRCRDCKIFGHADDQCPKRVKEPVMETPTIQNDGFTMVQNQKKKGKETTNTQTRHADGFKVNKNTPKHVWNIKSKKPVPKPTGDSSKLVNTNPFEALNDMKSGNEMGEASGGKEETITVKDKENDTDSESEVEEMGSESHPLVIPMGIVSDIQQIIRGFLWCNGEYKRGKAKVAWDDFCLPKKERGLGLRSLEVFNLALMTTHIWNLVSNKESLWVRWINTYKLRGRTIWDVQPKANMSYGWRKLLQLREHVKPFFWSCIGNGMNTSLWYDTWSTHCPLSKLLSPRDITREGYSIHTCVADLIVNGAWNWPLSWLAKAPNLGLVPTPTLTASSQDRRKWRDTNGTMTDFTVKCAWEALRPRGNEAPWFHIVWFTHAIPRHAFQLWLIMRRSLKTQDKLRQWDVDPATDLTQVRCSLCGTQADSHEHLFFECSYSSKVWSLIRGLVGMDVVPPVLENIIAWFQPLANKRTVQNIVGKILIAAATYFIWLERNNLIRHCYHGSSQASVFQIQE
ncbi:putative reverse transcriptase domain-containing protein [Tanacetum coccineum]